jgi:hypothetical protein
VPKIPRSRRVPIAGARARLADTIADVVNVSRTGALVRTALLQRPGAQWPLLLELSTTPVQLTARVVRCVAAVTRRGARRQYMLGLQFVDPSAAATAELDRICKSGRPTKANPRRIYISFARRCPLCKSRAVSKDAKRHYSCTDCGHVFTGIRIGIVRFAK